MRVDYLFGDELAIVEASFGVEGSTDSFSGVVDSEISSPLTSFPFVLGLEVDLVFLGFAAVLASLIIVA